MIINYSISGAGFICLAIAGFLHSFAVGFLVLGLSLLCFGIIFDLERL